MEIDNKVVTYDIFASDSECRYESFIEDAIEEAQLEKLSIEQKINDSLDTINKLTPQCDKIDYALAVSSGVICGLLDIFLVAKPSESVFGEITDDWYKKKVEQFMKLNGCSSLRALQDKYLVPYDQTTGGPIFKEIMGMNSRNHHFKSLPHNPTLLGLFFSILDQFSNPHLSHFVANGEMITLVDSDSKFVLRGNDVISKFYCAFVNWIGHLMSDVSGSHSSKGRGMGLPSPLWAWSNDVIAIKRSLKIEPSQFDKSFNDLALKMYTDGYDARFQTAQGIPVFINEMVTRLLYSVRRLLKYYSIHKGSGFSIKEIWEECEPFSNATVKRMLTVAHGTFTLIDIGDVTLRSIGKGGYYAAIYEMCVRLNVIGVGRFTISLIGEVNRHNKKQKTVRSKDLLEQRKEIVDEYLTSLYQLANYYDDKYLLTFVDDLKTSDCYVNGFNKTKELADKRGGDSLKNLEDIDQFFLGGKKDE